MNLPTIIAVASGGAFGATFRLFLNGLINKNFSNTIPLGTLGVNLLGSLIIGILFAYFHLNTNLSPYIRTFIITGFLGALTTYSTFAMESFLLFEANHYSQAILNMLLNLFGTITLAGVGYIIVMNLVK